MPARIEHPGLIYLLVGIVFSACLALSLYLYQLERERELAGLRNAVAQESAAIRARIEYEVGTTLNLTLGMVMYVATRPQLDQAEFDAIAARVLQRAPHLRNIALARDNVITHMAPLAGNEAALGFRYMDSPTQRDGVLRAIASRNTVIAGPVNLVQGGRGFISRTPIFLDSAQTQYWGLASLVMDVDAFIARTGMAERGDGLRFALRGRDGEGARGAMIHGDPDLFARPDALLSTIQLPEGTWQLAAYPSSGWQPSGEASRLALYAGLLLSLLVSLLVFALLRSLGALSAAKRQAEQANAVKTRFFSHMTHELRAPLSALEGALQQLADDTVRKEDAHAHPLLDQAVRNSARLGRVIDDILDIKRIEADGITYAFARCHVQGVIDDALEQVEPLLNQYHSHVEVETYLAAEETVWGDPHRLAQVLVNLLGNAIRHSPEGSTLTLHASRVEQRLRIEVIDKGPGMDEEALAAVLGDTGVAFLSGDAGGTGLGLSLSRLIIAQHQGVLGAYNVVGRGSSFYIELPLQPA